MDQKSLFYSTIQKREDDKLDDFNVGSLHSSGFQNNNHEIPQTYMQRDGNVNALSCVLLKHSKLNTFYFEILKLFIYFAKNIPD